jgi:hypothetical protein
VAKAENGRKIDEGEEASSNHGVQVRFRWISPRGI